MRLRPPFGSTAFLAALLVPALLGGQVVRGTVLDAAGGQPARGALVTLVDTSGARITPTLVDSAGGYRLVAPGPGGYRVRVDLIGYETWLSPPQAIGARDSVTLDVRLPLRRVALEAITIEDARRCEAQPQQVPQMLALWEEIRRALTISDLSTRRGLVPLDVEVTELRRRARGGLVTVGRQRTRANGSRPWAARSPKELAERGFVLGAGSTFDFIGPDAPILLSSEFVATHCFRSVRRRNLFGRANGIGLSFEPVRGRTLPDLKGTIWLDAQTSELRTVDFEFVNLTVAMAAAGPAKGSLEFARQPAGAWYVRRWEMAQQYGNAARGVATPVVAQAGTRGRRAPALLRGVVTDSTTGDALVGAIVHVPGIDSLVTDSLGRFEARIVDMTADSLDFLVGIEHPRLGVLGLASAEQTVRLRAGEPVTINAAIPSVRTLMGAMCPADGVPAARPGGLLVGRVVSPDALPDDAHVVAEWPSDERLGEGVAARSEERMIRLGSDGRFRVCPLPVGRTIRLAVEAGGVRGPTTEVTLPASAIAEVELGVRP